MSYDLRRADPTGTRFGVRRKIGFLGIKVLPDCLPLPVAWKIVEPCQEPDFDLLPMRSPRGRPGLRAEPCGFSLQAVQGGSPPILAVAGRRSAGKRRYAAIEVKYLLDAIHFRALGHASQQRIPAHNDFARGLSMAASIALHDGLQDVLVLAKIPRGSPRRSCLGLFEEGHLRPPAILRNRAGRGPFPAAGAPPRESPRCGESWRRADSPGGTGAPRRSGPSR